jgi:DNA-binding GntR family transcriptional regulator
MSNGTTELDRPVPLYMQVVRQLRAQIASGELRDGDRLPSQREMMARWHISMQTASKVIGAMKTEGIAIPSVGRDTLVAPGAAARIAAVAQGTAHAPAAEIPPAPGAAVTAVTAAKTAAPGPVAEILGIPSGRRALRRTETRSDAGHAASITIAWYPPAIADLAPRLADSQPIPAGPLAYIAEATATRAARADEDHAAAAADDDTAAALGITAGSPVLITRTRHYAADGKLIEYAETTIPAGRRYSRTYTITGN